jgi:hypothetical protein
MDGERRPEGEGKSRRSYAAPVLEKFALRPEEAVLGGCKVTTQSGSLNRNRCRSAIGPCSAQVS